jgi:NADH-quinone oxidoreductase subunit L
MEHDPPGYYRFFAYLNLFMFSMLILVLANNFLLMFVGWEGVGLCSYLLIGYYFSKKSAGDAAKKAFIVNRIGDVGFVLGILLIFFTFESLDFSAVFGRVVNNPNLFPVEAGATWGTLTWITILLFIGATGKSAQVPLYVWLPDAMEGPTPVSALIHAATMVTAGIYMVVRCNPLFARAPHTMQIVASIGIFTALFAATIALVQRDIKRILAYSTVSQLGYMFAAAGVGAFTVGIFHLVTHAFFKALLFLGAGSVITAFHHQEQDVMRMGGLKRYLPVTCWTMWFGTLAIAGIPPFAGFFSKDEILWQAISQGHEYIWFIGWIVAGLTAFYSSRLMFLTFHGDERIDEHLKHHLHESPGRMTTPLILLAFFSLGVGFIGVPSVDRYFHFDLEKFLEPVMQAPTPALGVQATPVQFLGFNIGHGGVMGLSVVMSLIGLVIAYLLYVRYKEWPDQWAAFFGRLYTFALNKYKIDELYDTLIINPIRTLSRSVLWQFFDVEIIDGTVNRLGRLLQSGGFVLRHIQSGYTRNYAAWILFGVILVLIYFIR